MSIDVRAGVSRPSVPERADRDASVRRREVAGPDSALGLADAFLVAIGGSIAASRHVQQGSAFALQQDVLTTTSSSGPASAGNASGLVRVPARATAPMGTVAR